MFSKVGQIMLYVNNQDQARAFWTEKAGFHLVHEEDNGQGMRWIEVAPTPHAETSLVLHSKAIVAKMSPELHLGTPSLMFYTDELDQLYDRLSGTGVKVGELVEMPFGRVFNFADDEENYFAVTEKK